MPFIRTGRRRVVRRIPPFPLSRCHPSIAVPAKKAIPRARFRPASDQCGSLQSDMAFCTDRNQASGAPTVRTETSSSPAISLARRSTWAQKRFRCLGKLYPLQCLPRKTWDTVPSVFGVATKAVPPGRNNSLVALSALRGSLTRSSTLQRRTPSYAPEALSRFSIPRTSSTRAESPRLWRNRAISRPNAPPGEGGCSTWVTVGAGLR